MGYPIWLGEMAIATADSSVTTNGNAQTIAASSGVYTYSATGAESLVGLVQAAIVAVVGAGYTCTFSHSTGKVTFANASGTNASTVFSSAVAARLGLSSTTLSVNNGANATSSYPCLGTWLPGKYTGERRVPAGEIGAIESDTVGTMNRDGTVYTTSYETRYADVFRYRWLPKRQVYPVSGYTYQDAKGFWAAVLWYGKRVRLVEDPDSSTTPLATYYPMQATSGSFAPKRSLPTYDGFWDYEIAVSAVRS